MDNQETLVTVGTQDTSLRQTKTTQKHNTTQKTKTEHHRPNQNGGCETDTRCLLELDGNLASLYFLIVRRYVYGWHNPIQRILELWSCELDKLKEVCSLFVMMKCQLEIKTIHKECALLTKIPLSLSVTCIFHWKKCLKIPKGVLFRTRYSVLMDEYLHSHLNVRLALVVRGQQVYH